MRGGVARGADLRGGQALASSSAITATSSLDALLQADGVTASTSMPTYLRLLNQGSN